MYDEQSICTGPHYRQKDEWNITKITLISESYKKSPVAWVECWPGQKSQDYLLVPLVLDSAMIVSRNVIYHTYISISK